MHEPGNLVYFLSFNKPPSRSRSRMGCFMSEETAQDTEMAGQDKSLAARIQEDRGLPRKGHWDFLPHDLGILKPIKLCD